MDKRLLTIQDISCVGQCSLTVALPVISACGIETAILPSSILSTHTAGFTGYTCRDLTCDMPAVLAHWKKEGISFDAFYTGYVNKEQIPLILQIMQETARPGAVKIIDPVMADNGVLYKGFAPDFPAEMKRLCYSADIILPNLTEAAFLLNEEYAGDSYTADYIEGLLCRLKGLGPKHVILTGVSFEPEKLGVAVYDGEDIRYYFTERIGASMHGTGDVYSSTVVGAICRGWSVYYAAALGADVVVESMKATLNDKEHWYGVKFEKALAYLISRIAAADAARL